MQRIFWRRGGERSLERLDAAGIAPLPRAPTQALVPGVQITSGLMMTALLGRMVLTRLPGRYLRASVHQEQGQGLDHLLQVMGFCSSLQPQDPRQCMHMCAQQSPGIAFSQESHSEVTLAEKQLGLVQALRARQAQTALHAGRVSNGHRGTSLELPQTELRKGVRRQALCRLPPCFDHHPLLALNCS